MLSRRDLVGKIATGAAGAAVAWAAVGVRTSAASTRSGTNGLIGSRQGDGAVGEQLGLPQGEGFVGETASTTSVPSPVSAPAPAVEESNATPPVVEVAPPPWELLRPLSVGSLVTHGWRVADLGGPTGGACVLTLKNESGRTQRIHICRHEGQPEGLVYTKHFELVVMNGGKGDLGTDESLAQAVAEVSHVLAANESAWRHETVLAALMPHSERVRRFSADNEWTLR